VPTNKLYYHFVTKWQFNVPRNLVWTFLEDIETIPQWWPGVKRFEMTGYKRRLELGSRVKVAVQGLLGQLRFTLEVTECRPDRLMRFKCAGDLEGEGVWNLYENEGTTYSVFTWDVSTSGYLMNLVGSVLKPVLAWNHNRVMAKGYGAIRRKLEAKFQSQNQIPGL